MDKLAPAIEWLKKNKFWVGSAALALAMLTTWILVTLGIDKQTEKYTSDVKSHITKGESILRVSAEEGVRAHPNEYTSSGMQELLEQSLEKTIEAWKLRYDAQQKILKWSPEVAENEEFLNYFSRFDPPETYPDESGKGREAFAMFYRTQIGRQMERIAAEVLNAKWDFDPKYKDIKMTGDEELAKFAVKWNADNQRLWNRKLTTFRGWDNHDLDINAPVPLQIYMLQQDLWLLEAMFAIIREVNGDVRANDLAKIKRIDHIAFGREVGPKLGKLTPLPQTTNEPDFAGGMAGRSDFGSGGGFNEEFSDLPFHHRYVSTEFKPLSATVVSNVLTAVKEGNEFPVEHLELVVARRVPVRIALRMDEREIPAFMSACANSPFAFEIQQVRKNRHKPGEGIVFNGGGDTRAGREQVGSEMGMGDNRRGGRGEGMDGASASQSKPVETRTNYDVDVEFFGIVKIYNPPVEKYLRRVIGADDPDVAGDGSGNTSGLATR
jgi:hypothetical protein